MKYGILYKCKYELFKEETTYPAYIIFHPKDRFDLFMENEGNQFDVFFNEEFEDAQNMIDAFGRVNNIQEANKKDYLDLFNKIFTSKLIVGV